METGKERIGEMDPRQELSSQGLKPMGWEDVLREVQGKLSAEDWKTFSRLHRNFVGYVSQGTLARFYGFVFSHGLQREINGFRFHRLEKIIAALAARPERGARVLDVGAGAGIVAGAARKILSPSEYVAQDLCDGARDYLSSRGFPVLPHPLPASPQGKPFDLILCADSLGELNSDEDAFLSQPANASLPLFAEAIEERYGFAQKLQTLKPYLSPSGRLLMWEPFSHRAVWEALARYLGPAWKTRLDTGIPGGEYLELSIP
jgi:hypothetical protein